MMKHFLLILLLAMPALAQLGPFSFTNGNMIWVDGLAGIDATALKNRSDKPFKTPHAAKAVANSGDTIIFRPFFYSATNLLKTGVNYYGYAGCTISNHLFIGGNRGLFDDRECPNGTTNVISGDWNFIHNSDLDDESIGKMLGLLVVTNANSQIDFRANNVYFQSGSGVFHSNAVIHVKNCRNVTVHLNEINMPNTANYSTGIYWEKGTTTVTVASRILGNADASYGIWCIEPAGGVSSSLRVVCPFIGSPGLAAIRLEGNSPNWRNWLEVNETDGPIQIFGGGRNYFVGFSKMGGTTPLSIAGGINWLDSQKISGSQGFASISGGENHIDINHWEATAQGVHAPWIDITGGSNIFYKGHVRVTNAIAIRVSGTTDTRLQDMVIQTVNSTPGGNTNEGIRVWTNGVTIQNISVTTSAGADSITATNTINPIAVVGGANLSSAPGSAVVFTGGEAPTVAGKSLFAVNHAVAVSLTADNQVVSTTNRSYIRLSSDNGTAGNRTFVLTPGTYDGQVLELEWTGTNAGEIADDSSNTGGGNNRLSATWTPTQYDTLFLRFNGTDWVQRGLSAN